MKIAELCQDPDCPCGCCGDPVIGCLCDGHPAEERCLCRYCTGLRKTGGGKPHGPTGILGVIPAEDASLHDVLRDQVAEILTLPSVPPVPTPQPVIEQLREWYDTIRAMEPPPPPRHLEVGWLAHARLRQLARQPDSPIARRFNPAWTDLAGGIPIQERADLAAEAWRLMEGDKVIKEGAL